MPESSSSQVTNLLLAWRQGKQEALNQLVPIVHAELRRRAHCYLKKERGDHTLQTSALINEAYMKLLNYREIDWKNRAHFLAVMSQLMRRILVDYARAHNNRKRRRGTVRISLDLNQIPYVKSDPSLVELDYALRALSEKDERKSRVVELRFFGGLNVKETAEVLGVCVDTVMRDWRFAKAWLTREMNASSSDEL